MVNFYLGSISRKNGNSNEHCSKIFKRIFLAYRSRISISGPGPQRKDRRHGDHTDGLHGGGVLRGAPTPSARKRSLHSSCIARSTRARWSGCVRARVRVRVRKARSPQRCCSAAGGSSREPCQAMRTHRVHLFQARPEPLDSKNWCLGSSNSFANVSAARRSVHSAACTMEQRVPLGVQWSRGDRRSAARLDRSMTAAARPGRLRRSSRHRAASMAATVLHSAATSRATMPPSHEILSGLAFKGGVGGTIII